MGCLTRSTTLKLSLEGLLAQRDALVSQRTRIENMLRSQMSLIEAQQSQLGQLKRLKAMAGTAPTKAEQHALLAEISSMRKESF